MAAGTDDGFRSDASDQDEELGAAQIADPDNYNRRRRLKQLHDAKERVLDIAERTATIQATDPSFDDRQRDQLVAEAVVSFVEELDSLLAAQENARSKRLLRESFATVEGEERTVQEFVDGRGILTFRDNGETKSAVAPYQASMKAFRVAREQFDALVAPDIESRNDPVDKGFGPDRGERQ